MLNTDTEILIFLLRNDRSVCPPADLVKKSTAKLYEKALLNKVFPALDHFTDCQACQKYLNKSFKNKLVKHQKTSLFSCLLYEKERQHLISFLKKTKTKGIFFKDSKNKLQQKLFLTNDIDLLTDERGAVAIDRWLISQDYKKTIYPPKETTYSKAHHLNIDLHTMIAHPHFGALSKLESSIVKNFSTAILNKTKYSQQSFFIQNKDYQLLSLCIRFLFNDLATGLGALYKIAQLTQAYKNPSQWNKFLRLAKKYQFENEAWLMVLLSSRFFQQPLPNFMKKNAPWKVRLLANLLPIEWFAQFPAIKFWHSKKYESKVRNINTRLNILKLIIKKDTSLVRLVRPRIVLFFLTALLINIKEWLNKFAKKISDF